MTPCHGLASVPVRREVPAFKPVIELIRLAIWCTFSLSADLSGNPLLCERIMPETV